MSNIWQNAFKHELQKLAAQMPEYTDPMRKLPLKKAVSPSSADISKTVTPVPSSEGNQARVTEVATDRRGTVIGADTKVRQRRGVVAALPDTARQNLRANLPTDIKKLFRPKTVERSQATANPGRRDATIKTWREGQPLRVDQTAPRTVLDLVQENQ